MAGVFLTTPALQIFLLWQESPLTKYLIERRADEVWMSPLSHAILRDSYLQSSSIPDALRRRGLREVDRHRRKMEAAGIGNYPLPNAEAVRIWTEIRSLRIDIPSYDDGIATYPAQQVGPDELLIFASAAAFSKPLIGPGPDEQDIVEYLKDLGIVFTELNFEVTGAGDETPVERVTVRHWLDELLGRWEIDPKPT
jgi:hypothetical protein